MSNNLLLLLSPHFHSLDHSVQEEVYNDFYKFLYAPILYLLRDHAATEDIIQETFLKVLRKQPRVDNDAQLKAWIKVVAKNATLSYLRKVKRDGLSLDSYLGEDELFVAAGGESVEREVEFRSLEETITYHVDRMRPDHKAILEMKWKKGLSYKEIADETKQTEGTVRSKLHTARSYLRRVLRQDWRGSK